MELKTEWRIMSGKISEGKPAEIKMWKGLKVRLKTDSEERVQTEIIIIIIVIIIISKKDIKNHSQWCTNPTNGSKGGGLRSWMGLTGTQKGLQSSRGMDVVMEGSLAAPLAPQTWGRYLEETRSPLHQEGLWNVSPFVKYNYSFDVSFLLLENMLEAESPLRDQLGNFPSTEQ